MGYLDLRVKFYILIKAWHLKVLVDGGGGGQKLIMEFISDYNGDNNGVGQRWKPSPIENDNH